MSSLCSAREQSAYATGKMTRADERVFRPGGLELTARAIALARLGAGATVLDLGCGAGQSVAYLHTLGIDAVGIDCAGSDKQGPRGLATYERIVASAEDLPFPNGSVDGVLTECSLSVIEDQDAVLAECARVLADGGRLMISDLYARQPEAIGGVRGLKESCVAGMIVREELEGRLAAHGFTVDVWEDHSQALRECAARFIFEHGSLEGMWSCDGGDSAESIQGAMRATRAGYFLMVAIRNKRELKKGEWEHER
jgi:arsenite methyltransferase